MISAFGVVHDYDPHEISKSTESGGAALGRILARNAAKPGKLAARKTARAADLTVRASQRGNNAAFKRGFDRTIGPEPDSALAQRRMTFLRGRAYSNYGRHGEKLQRTQNRKLP